MLLLPLSRSDQDKKQTNGRRRRWTELNRIEGNERTRVYTFFYTHSHTPRRWRISIFSFFVYNTSIDYVENASTELPESEGFNLSMYDPPEQTPGTEPIHPLLFSTTNVISHLFPIANKYIMNERNRASPWRAHPGCPSCWGEARGKSTRCSQRFRRTPCRPHRCPPNMAYAPRSPPPASPASCPHQPRWHRHITVRDGVQRTASSQVQEAII